MARGAAVAEATNEDTSTLADDLRASLAEESDENVEHLDIAISGESTAEPETESSQAAGADAVDSAGSAEQPPEPQPSPILERLRQHGIEAPVQDEAALADYLAVQLREAQQARQYLQDNLQQIRQWQQWAANEQARQAQVQAQPEKPATPKFDPAWQQYRELGEDGKLGWHPETPAEVKQAFAAYQAYRNEFASKLIDDPASALENVLAEREAKIIQQIEAKYAQQAQQAQAHAAEQAWLNQNIGWMFQKGQDGQPLVHNGQRVPTPEGARMYQYFQQYAQHLPPAEAAEVAKQRVFNEIAIPYLLQQQQQQPAAPSPVEQHQTAKANTLRNVAAASRGGSARGHRTQEVDQGENLSLHEKLLRDFDAKNITDADLLRRN